MFGVMNTNTVQHRLRGVTALYLKPTSPWQTMCTVGLHVAYGPLRQRYIRLVALMPRRPDKAEPTPRRMSGRGAGFGFPA